MRRAIAALTWIVWSAAAAAQPALSDLDTDARTARQAADARAVVVYRDGLVATLAYALALPELFPHERLKKPRLLVDSERAAVRALWQRLLDYTLALDSIGRFHAGHAELPDKAAREHSFLIAYASALATYRHGLDFIVAAERNAGLDPLLNEAMPELGLPVKTYDQFKFRFLNVLRASEFAALEAVHAASPGRQDPVLRAAIATDAKAVWAHGGGQGVPLTLKNGLDIVRKAGVTAFFPVQAGVAEWMGDTKVYRVSRSLIGAEQIEAMRLKLEPGDILLERREWYLSNIGLPGYWPHAALYIGTPEERARYFDDATVHAWVRGQGERSAALDQLLKRRYPRAHQDSLRAQEHGHVPRVLEAISEGVSFTTLEHSADADAVAVLRPRLSKVEKARALARAFAYAGRPYDFDFDFLTDRALVCTELVYKAYEPGDGLNGLTFPLTEIMGRLATPANLIARQFDEQFGGEAQQSDLVLFLDGVERDKHAVTAGVEEFRVSWRRPKWHILAPELARREPAPPISIYVP
jgi:hypothetical protein